MRYYGRPMRQDLDRIMKERGLGGLVVFAYDRYSPAFHYVTGQKIHYGVYLRTADGNAHLVHDPMERDQAALAGCPTSGFPQHGLNRLLETEGHPARAFGALIAGACAQLGMRGPVAFHGELAAGFAHALVARVLELEPAIQVDLSQPDVIAVARMTKDEKEIAAIRHAARGTVAALEALIAHLRSLKRQGDHFVSNGRGTVRLGDLRRLLQEKFLAHGLAEDGDSIVSQGRDAGVPHNRGNDDELLRASAPLLIDIFPGEAGGGYHSDVTRTYCLGKAPDDLKRIYDDVSGAHRLAMDSLAVGAPCRSYQEKVCDFFEQRGHATVRSNDGVQEGYVHGLGHGVGLAVHEAPRLGGPPSNTQSLVPGMVITVEPGLYYPSKGVGVRIEDLVVVHPEGRFENLTPPPNELEIATS